MRIIEIKIPYPRFSGNHQHGTNGHHRFMRPEMRAWRDEVIYAIRSAGISVPISPGKVAASVLVCPPDRRTRDNGNVEKVVSDALQNAGVFAKGDSDQDAFAYLRGPVVDSGYVLIYLKPRRDEEYTADTCLQILGLL